jgi:hypothetical protein
MRTSNPYQGSLALGSEHLCEALHTSIARIAAVATASLTAIVIPPATMLAQQIPNAAPQQAAAPRRAELDISVVSAPARALGLETAVLKVRRNRSQCLPPHPQEAGGDIGGRPGFLCWPVRVLAPVVPAPARQQNGIERHGSSVMVQT